MDIEVTSSFAESHGTVDLLPIVTQRSLGDSGNSSMIVVEDSESPDELFADHAHSSILEEIDDNEFSDRMSVDEDDNQVADSHDSSSAEAEAEEIRVGRPTGVSEVVDMLFEIHTALKSRHLGQRTAASALAASNLVSCVAYPADPDIPRDEQIEMLENTRKMLECAICQEVYTMARKRSAVVKSFAKIH